MIRQINDDDRNYIYDIIKKEFNIIYKNDTPFTKWYIYEKNNIILGFANIDIIYDKAEIEYIFVLDEFRHQNIATEILKKIEADLQKRKIKNITLEVNEKNYKAIKFYEKNGFKKVTIRCNYYGSDNAFLMLKSW